MEGFPEQLARAHEGAVQQSRIEEAELQEARRIQAEQARLEREALERAQRPAEQIAALILPSYPDGILQTSDWLRLTGPIQRGMTAARYGRESIKFSDRFPISNPWGHDCHLAIQFEGTVNHKRIGGPSSSVAFPVGVSLIVEDGSEGDSVQKLAKVRRPEKLRSVPDNEYPWITIDGSWDLDKTQQHELQEQVIAWIDEVANS